MFWHSTPLIHADNGHIKLLPFHLQSILCVEFVALRIMFSLNSPLSRRLSSAASSLIKNYDKQHVVVALGGNALLKRGEPLTIDNQRKNIREGISSLTSILRNNKVTFVHGNGPQVGLLALQGAAYQQKTGAVPMELDILDAETEGSIGYMLEQEIDSALGKDGRERGVITMLTQIVVDPDDQAFNNPTKFIMGFDYQLSLNDILSGNSKKGEL